jgi:hypothetical protein
MELVLIELFENKKFGKLATFLDQDNKIFYARVVEKDNEVFYEELTDEEQKKLMKELDKNNM